MAENITIWLTRPHADSAPFADELSTHGIESIVAPVLHINHQPTPVFSTMNQPSALLITSRHATHALAAFPSTWRQLPTYCVGKATAISAKKYGLTRIIHGESNAMTLLPRILSDIPAGSTVLYLAGNETRTELLPQLSAQNIHVTSAIVYHAVAEQTLSDDIQHALKEQHIHAVAFFSPRSADIACGLMQQNGIAETAANMHAYCLSANVAHAARALPWAAIHTCPAPTRQAMRELIVSHTRKKG